MPDVKYVDEQGFAWLKRVKDKTVPTMYRRGITIGPPDLSSLSLEQDELKRLQNALVDAYLVNAELIRGNVTQLHNVIKGALPHKNTRELVKQVKVIYQQEYFRGD